MAESSDKQDAWTEGLASFAEAAKLNLTASRLAVAGMVALGAAATAYLWDAERRNRVTGMGQRWADEMMGLWGRSTSTKGPSSGSSSSSS